MAQRLIAATGTSGDLVMSLPAPTPISGHTSRLTLPPTAADPSQFVKGSRPSRSSWSGGIASGGRSGVRRKIGSGSSSTSSSLRSFTGKRMPLRSTMITRRLSSGDAWAMRAMNVPSLPKTLWLRSRRMGGTWRLPRAGWIDSHCTQAEAEYGEVSRCLR